MAPISRVMGELVTEMSELMSFLMGSTWVQNRHLPTANDFVLGNPHEMPVPAIGEALAKASVPQDVDWFAYKLSEDEAREAAAEGLRRTHGDHFTEADIQMTGGAFAGLAIAMHSLLDPGDEVIYMLPPWFFYHPMIRAAGGVPVPVRVRQGDWNLDLEAIEAAITERTRAVIVNSPNNPTGRIFPAETLRGLAEILEGASERNGRPVYVLSDESYSRILYDGRTYESPTAHYPRSVLIYTYGKTTLAPGLRLGYIALRPDTPDREMLQAAMFMASATLGWAFPVSLLQQALPDLERVSIDLEALQRKRDTMVNGLREVGYEVHVPEGTFYLLVKSPIEDDMAFTEQLAGKEIYVLPGKLIDQPGYFRISLTASEAMIRRATPRLAELGLTLERGVDPR